MANPYAIQIHCDGAMDYDGKQTGGNGFIIEFPESIGIEPITASIRNDRQGIHRLELISLIEAMEELLSFGKKNLDLLRKASGVEIYTDRLRATDGELTNPYRIRDWRRNGWKNHENKPIKDRDLLDKIDKARVKVAQIVGGRVSINYEREKKNKVADKLSKTGKRTGGRGRKLIEKKGRRVTRRLYDGSEVKYSQLDEGDVLEMRLYAWEPVGEEYEACFEICSGELKGKIVKVYIDDKQKATVHRTYRYGTRVDKVNKHHIRVKQFTELSKGKKK